jgi:hypothetical protein
MRSSDRPRGVRGGEGWRGVARLLVELSDALEKASAVRNCAIVAENGRSFEVEDAERGEVILNERVGRVFVHGVEADSELAESPERQPV